MVGSLASRRHIKRRTDHELVLAPGESMDSASAAEGKSCGKSGMTSWKVRSGDRNP
jgi:hypothetical protein